MQHPPDVLDARFFALADSVPVLLWLNGPDGCAFVNRAYLEFLGLHEQTDVRGNDWLQYVHPDDRGRYLQTYHASLAERAPFDAEFRFRRHDGQYLWMRSVARVLWHASGEFAGYAGCTFDINDARVASAALRMADRRKDEFLATLA